MHGGAAVLPSGNSSHLYSLDLYGRNIHFTNKSHLADKQFEIRWDVRALEGLLLKRALLNDDVRAFVRRRARLNSTRVEELSQPGLRRAIDSVLGGRVIRTRTFEWMVSRATDAKGVTYPREMIAFANFARDEQRGSESESGEYLIGPDAAREAYPHISRMRCEAFLSEFPALELHFRRFRGAGGRRFSRDALNELFVGLTPEGVDAIDRLWDVGLLRPADGRDVSVAAAFEVPPLYTFGLGIRPSST